MKIYKLTIFEINSPASSFGTMISSSVSASRPILVEYFVSKDNANARKNKTIKGLQDLLGAGGHGRYEIEVQEIEVND